MEAADDWKSRFPWGSTATVVDGVPFRYMTRAEYDTEVLSQGGSDWNTFVDGEPSGDPNLVAGYYRRDRRG